MISRLSKIIFIKKMSNYGGAAMCMAALAAKGKSKISNIEHILRGYENLDKKLTKLGANIKMEM